MRSINRFDICLLKVKEDDNAPGQQDGKERRQAPVVSDYRCAVYEMEDSYSHLDEDLARELIPNSPDERSSEYEFLLHTSITRDFMVPAGSLRGGLPIFRIEEREGSDDSDSDEEKNEARKVVEPKLPNWKHGDFTNMVTIPDENIIIKGKHNGTPLEVFLSFFTEELILLIVDQTNLYSTQKYLTYLIIHMTNVRSVR